MIPFEADEEDGTFTEMLKTLGHDESPERKGVFQEHASRCKDELENGDDQEDLDAEEEDGRRRVTPSHLEREFFLGSDSEQPLQEAPRSQEIDPKLEAVHAAQAFMFTKSGGTRKALVDWGPRTGHIRLWKDKYGEGWIEPEEPIENDCMHPSGMVWFYDREASENFTKKNIVDLPVKFMLYEQNFKLGAAFVTLLERPGEQQKSCSSSRPRRQRAREDLQTECRKRRRTEEIEEENEEDEIEERSEENEDEQAEMAEMENESFCDEDAGQEDQDGSQDSPRNSHAANAVYEKYDEDEEEDDNYKQELDEIPQVPQPPREPPPKRPRAGAPGSAHQNAKSMLQAEVPLAMKGLAEKETAWSPSDLSKRTLKYFVGGLSAAEHQEDWNAAAEKFMRSSLDSFSRACCSKPWFLDAEDLLKPILHSVSWELIQDCSDASECLPESLQELVEECYGRMMDGCNFDHSVRDAVHQSFGQHGKEIEAKVVTALLRTHEGAVKKATEAEGSSMRKIEAFTKSWMNLGMDRASVMLSHPEELFSEDAILELFRLLLSPTISESYTCVPRHLRSPKGRPPRNWNYIRPCVRELLKRWREAKGSSGKSQKNGDKVEKKPLPKQVMPAALKAKK